MPGRNDPCPCGSGIKNIEPMNVSRPEWNCVQTTNFGVFRYLPKLTLDGDVLVLESRKVELIGSQMLASP